MKKNKDNDLVKDDEILRIQAMEDGEKIIAGKKMRPITALTISWMQRHRVFSDEMDMIWKASAFAFLHCEDFSRIRNVINDHIKFVEAVDIWIEKNLKHHFETNEIADAMNNAFAVYMSSATSTETGETRNYSGN